MTLVARLIILWFCFSAAIFSSSCSDDIPDSEEDVDAIEMLFEADATTEKRDQLPPNEVGELASGEETSVSGTSASGTSASGSQPVDQTDDDGSGLDREPLSSPATPSSPRPTAPLSEELILDRESVGSSPSLDGSIFEGEKSRQDIGSPTAKPVSPSVGSSAGGSHAVGGVIAQPQSPPDEPSVPAITPKPYHPKGNLHTLALRSKNPTIVSGLKPNTSIDMRGEEGTILKVSENALEFENGTLCRTPVELRVWEFYDFADILLAGLSTESDEGLLETGGMVYMEAESRGRKLRLRKGSNAKITFSPKREIDSGFELYQGGMRDGRIHWAKAPKPEAPAASASLMVSTNSKVSTTRGVRYIKDHLPPFGFLQFLAKDDLPEDATIVTDFSKTQKFAGWGEVSFSNGVSLFYVGQLELTRFQAGGPVDYDRFSNGAPEKKPSELEIRFSGSFLSGKIPSLHKNSILRIFIQNREFPIPYVTCSPDKKAGFFTLDEQFLFEPRPRDPRATISPATIGQNGQSGDQELRPEVRCIHGKTSIYTAGKYIHLDAANNFFSDKLTSGQDSGLSPQRLDRKDFIDSLLKGVYEKLNSDLKQMVGPVETPTSLNSEAITFSLNRLKERLKASAARGAVRNIEWFRREFQRQLAPLSSRVEDLSYFKDAGARFQSFAREHGFDDDQTDYSSLIAEIDDQLVEYRKVLDFEIDEEAIQEILVVAKKLNAFTSEFLSPQLGWHNLDKLRHARGPDAPYELVSEYIEPASISSTQANSPSMGPFYYSVWPTFNISIGAVPGENRIPGGDFMALGFAVDGKGNIHADIKAGKTNRQVVLELKQMDRETFRKKVKGFQ
jgi:hypothetical protein